MGLGVVADDLESLETQSSSGMPDLRNKAFDVIPTERGGFEPPKPVSQFNGLANRRYRPLSHLSREKADDSADSLSS
jgi:hypothetical protein